VSNQADIRDIQILGDLKAAFGRFGEDVSQILASLQKQFEEVLGQWDERQDHWRRQVETAQEEVYEARRSLNECQSQPADEEGDSADCSSEEDQVADAEKLLAEYEENLETVKQWRHRIEALIADFQNDIHRLSNLASSRTSSAQGVLANKLEILNRYVGGSSATVGISGLQGQGGNAKLLKVAGSKEKELYYCARIRNQHLAGKKHDITGISFDKYGFPDFSSVAIKTVKIKVKNSKSDRRVANKQAGIAKEPRGYVWHHHEDGTTLQLVPEDVHRKTGHSGGAPGQDSLYTFSFPNYD
jgi:hypothetical protein